MAYLGFWDIDDYLTFYCNTHGVDGVAVDADAVPPYRIYEDETGAAITNANMALLDAANTVGFYSERLQLLAATGFEVGKQYVVYIAATVGGNVGTINHTFEIPDLADTAEIADGVWDEAAAGHTDAGKAGEQLWTDVDAILQDTGTDGVLLGLDSIKAVTYDETTAWPIIAADTGVTQIARVGADGDTLETISDQLDGTAVPGDAMNLAADAIKAVSYDESTAWPVIASDAGATQIARVGADGDTLETLSDQIDTVAIPGSAMTLAADAIKAVSYDESTAWPIIAADTGATQIARVGADGDTLETLSDQADLQATAVALATVDGNVDAILLDTGTTGVVSVVGNVGGNVVGTVASVVGDVGGNVVGDVQGNVDGSVASVTALSAAAVDSILDEVVEGTVTMRQALRAFMAALANVATGGGTLAVGYRDIANTKDRIAATVDVTGNRTAITLDLT